MGNAAAFRSWELFLAKPSKEEAMAEAQHLFKFGHFTGMKVAPEKGLTGYWCIYFMRESSIQRTLEDAECL